MRAPDRRPSPVRRRGAALSAAAVGLLLAGCTRAIVPLSVVTRTPPGPTASPTRTPGPTFIAISGDPTGHPYAVVWVPAESNLPVQQPAGIPGLQVGVLPPDQRGISLTGNSTLLGSSLWVEILAPEMAGWVNSWYLTEDVSPPDFCSDPQVTAVLSSFGEAILGRDGRALAALASPRRGLIIRHDWWNPEVIVPPQDVSGIYFNESVYDWGESDTPGSPVEGTFDQVVWPLLADVFGGESEVTCNSLRTGMTTGEVRWPGEYTNLNFYAFYRPAADPGSQLTWHTWAVGMEYVDGRPWVTVLVHYRAELLPGSGN
jgi:hypothetical protein